MTPFPSNELTPSPCGSETEAREEGVGPAGPQPLVGGGSLAPVSLGERGGERESSFSYKL